MKTMKKILCSLLVVVMCLTSAPLGGFVGIDWPDINIGEWFGSKASAYTEGYYTYTVADGEATITDVDTSISGDVVIPSTIGGYNVVKISTDFLDCDNVVKITIPETVVGLSIFNCKNLSFIEVDSNNPIYSSDEFGVLFDKQKLVLIQFPRKSKATTYTVPDGVVYVLSAFSMSNIERVTFPDSVKEIYEQAFFMCDNLKYVNIGNGVEKIGRAAFALCANLLYFEIGRGLTELSSDVFQLSFVEKFVVSDENRCFSSDAQGALYNKDKTTLICYPARSENDTYVIPKSLNEILEVAFNYSWFLKRIVVPEENECFSSDKYGVLFDKTKTTLIYHPAGNERTTYTIPNGVTTIGSQAFLGSAYLKSIFMPISVIEIKSHAFADNTGLKDVYYEGSEEQWKSVSMEAWNTIRDSIIHYESATCTHRYSSNINAQSTCIKSGVVTHICSCGDSYIEEIPVDSNNHAGETEIRGYVAPTCTQDGYSGDTYCLDCGECISYGEVIGKSGHGETEIRGYVAPTCTQDGYSGDTYCLDCGECISNGEVIPTTEHNDDDNNDICDGCGADLGEETECEHTATAVVLMSATCTQGGMAYDVCSKCGETLSDIYTSDALGHDMSDFVQTKAPTCTEKGEERADCSRCDYYKTKEIEEKGHSFGEWETVKNPTATEAGLKQRTCGVCGETEEEEIDKLPVLIDEKTGIMIEYPAEEYDGEMGMTVEETLDKTVINIVSAADGVTKNKVYDIKLTLDGVAIQPKGKVKIKIPLPEGYSTTNTYVYYLNTITGKPEKLDAVYEDGYMVFETDHFSYYALAEVQSHTHSYDNIDRNEATCIDKGWITYTCNCGESYSVDISATGHTFDGSECVNCDYDKADECDCNCHASGIKAFFFKIKLFFWKLFKKNPVCDCGAAHY